MTIELTWQRADVSKYIDYKKEGYKLHTRATEYKKDFPFFIHKKQLNGCEFRVSEAYMVRQVNISIFRDMTPNKLHIYIGRLAYLNSISWTKYVSGKFVGYHRVDGPADIWFYRDDMTANAEWHINGVRITEEVNKWIDDMGMPPFYEWDDGHKSLFMLAFA